AVIIGAVILLFGPRASPRLTLKLYGARPLHRVEAPDLYRLIAVLAERARLPRIPELYYVPTAPMNAFAVGTRSEPIITVTDGLLRNLSSRELTGVLAHELSHVRSNDMWVMTLADSVSRLTSWFSLMGQMLLFINLPLILFGGGGISWWAILLLIFAPMISVLLQLALSRTREFDADLDAAQITGDPIGLASALRKLDHYQGGLLRRLLVPGRRRAPDSWILSTHPSTEERIRRLAELAETQPPEPIMPSIGDLFALLEQQPPARRLPWWLFTRLEH
ncbi:MAG: zinc metalloprotease HtpX, partial [Acidiferrobacterales bacterium]|nr:zinc metalloprotease HtpX [Acidiferrobacterales bacterium]